MAEQRFPAFQQRFHDIRAEKGMTQNEYADYLSISRPTVGFYENGQRVPDALVLKQIAEKCEVPTDWLLGLTDIRSPDINVKSVCNYTGLSEESVEVLHYLMDRTDSDKISLSGVGLVIINKFISELKRAKGSKTEEDYETLAQFLYDYLFVMWSARNIAKEENPTLVRREITFGDDYEATISMRNVYDFKRDDIKKRLHSFADRIIEEETDKVVADAECKKQKGEYKDTDKTRKECKNNAEEQP